MQTVTDKSDDLNRLLISTPIDRDYLINYTQTDNTIRVCTLTGLEIMSG